jgi:hypothetical protein
MRKFWAVVVVVWLAGCTPRVHRAVNSTIAVAASALFVCDGMQTNSALQDGIAMEANPLLGKDPGPAKIYAVTWSQAFAVPGLALLPDRVPLWYQTLILVAVLAVEVNAVTNNAMLTGRSVLHCGR